MCCLFIGGNSSPLNGIRRNATAGNDDNNHNYQCRDYIVSLLDMIP